MADIVLFHSAYGLRPALLRAVESLRRLGHRVRTPDLLGGQVADSLTAALALRDGIGRAELLRRAQVEVAAEPPGTVLAGLSLGASLAQRVAQSDARFSRLLLLHGLAKPPASLPVPWKVQVHLSEDDPWAPRTEADAWCSRLEGLGARVELHWYRGGHLFTDEELPDHDAVAASVAWARARVFLEG